jgi:Dolichyl-phosphate-mannose-protein mannosyltransferase
MIRFNHVLVCIVLSLAVISPFFFIGESRAEGCCGGRMPVTHDMVSHYNLMQSFHKSLLEGNLYPRWQPEMHQGYGAPSTIFYPPGVFYLTSALFCLVRDWMMVVRLSYIVLMIGSGLTFYLLARSRLSSRAALVAMIAYQVAPYHLIDHYQRGALAECFGLVWMALVLRFAFDDRQGRRIESLIGLSFAWGLFVWSHPPTAFQTLLVFGPVLLIQKIIARDWKRLLEVGCCLIAGTLLASAYILPAFSEQHLIHSAEVEAGWPYAESYVFDFASQKYDHTADDFVIRIDHMWLFSLAAFGVLAAWLLKSRIREAFIWTGAGIWSLYLITPLSRPLNAIIPGIEIGVFSWRILATTTVCVAMLVGLSADSEKNMQTARTGRLLAVVMILASLVFSFHYIVFPMYRAEAFVPNPAHSNYSLVPIQGSREVPDRPEVSFMSGSGTARVDAWDSEWRSVMLDVVAAGKVAVRTFFFPGWIAKLDGKQVEILTGADGEIVIDVPAGSHRLTLEFGPTRVRSLGSFLSISTLVMLLGATFYAGYLRTRRKHPSETIKD